MIRLDDDVKEQIDILKAKWRKYGVKTVNDVIRKLLENNEKLAKSSDSGQLKLNHFVVTNTDGRRHENPE